MKLRYIFLFLLIIMQQATAKEYRLMEKDIDAGAGKVHLSIGWYSDTQDLIFNVDFPANVYKTMNGKIFTAAVFAERCPTQLFGDIFSSEVTLCAYAHVYNGSTSGVANPNIYFTGQPQYTNEILINDAKTVNSPAQHFTLTSHVSSGLKNLHVCFQEADRKAITSVANVCTSGEVPPLEPIQEETDCTLDVPTKNVDYGALNQSEINGSRRVIDYTIKCSAESDLSLSFEKGKINSGNAEVDIDLSGGLAAHLETSNKLHAGKDIPVSSEIYSTLVTSSQTVTVGKHSNSAVLKAEWP